MGFKPWKMHVVNHTWLCFRKTVLLIGRILRVKQWSSCWNHYNPTSKGYISYPSRWERTSQSWESSARCLWGFPSRTPLRRVRYESKFPWDAVSPVSVQKSHNIIKSRHPLKLKYIYIPAQFGNPTLMVFSNVYYLKILFTRRLTLLTAPMH